MSETRLGANGRLMVTVTPIAVQKDSRTFKQAASLARFGYSSVVVEGDRSSLEQDGIPFELSSPREHVTANQPQAIESGVSAPKSATKEWIKKWFARLNIYSVLIMVSFFWRTMGLKYGYHTLKRTPKADLYYLHAPYQFVPIFLLSRYHRVPFVYDAHDFYSGMESEREVGAVKRIIWLPFQRWLESQCARRASEVVTVGEGIARLQEEAFGVQARVVRNCHDARLDRSPAQSVREQLGLSDDDFLVVHVGHSKKGQALEDALRAVATLPDNLHLALLGNNYEEFNETILALGLENRVHLVDPVKPIEVVPFISSCDASLILYFPWDVNYLNALPNKFFQSVAAGLPLLYPPLPEMKRLADQYDLGIEIDPTSSDSIRDAMLTLLESPDLLRQFRQNAAIAGEELSWEHEEKVLKQLIEQVLHVGDE